METDHVNTEAVQDFTLDAKVQDVMNDPAFEGYGRLIFPANMKIDASLTLEDVEEILPWYSEVNPDRTVSIVNEMKSRVQNGEQIFYDIYTEEEKAADLDKKNTGLSEVTGTEPPTYACVGTSDGIASYRTMQSRINWIKLHGTNVEIEIFKGLSHGFGLGEGTVAEGWIDHAVAFWQENVEKRIFC